MIGQFLAFPTDIDMDITASLSALNSSPEGPTLEMCVQDSPFFREQVDLFESQVEEFVKWLDSLLKSLKTYTDDLSRMYSLLRDTNNFLQGQTRHRLM